MPGKKGYVDAELCVMNSPAKSGIELAQNRWDELTYAHLVQSNFMHRVVSHRKSQTDDGE